MCWRVRTKHEFVGGGAKAAFIFIFVKKKEEKKADVFGYNV